MIEECETKKQLCWKQSDFKEVIKRRQFNVLRQQLQKKDKISLKHKMRQDWIERIKILPPRLANSSNISKETLKEKVDLNDVNLKRNQFSSYSEFRNRTLQQDRQLFGMSLVGQKKQFQQEVQPNELSSPFGQNPCYNSRNVPPSKPKSSKFARKLQSLDTFPPQLVKINTAGDFLTRSISSNKPKIIWKRVYRQDQLNKLRFSISSYPSNIDCPVSKERTTFLQEKCSSPFNKYYQNKQLIDAKLRNSQATVQTNVEKKSVKKLQANVVAFSQPKAELLSTHVQQHQQSVQPQQPKARQHVSKRLSLLKASSSTKLRRSFNRIKTTKLLKKNSDQIVSLRG